MNRTFIRRCCDRAANIFLFCAAFALTAAAAAVAFFIIKKGAGALSWEFLSEPPRDGMMSGGVFTPLVGTVQLVLLSTGIALPIGVTTGLYFAEYAGDSRALSLMRVAIRSLAGVPSVIFGLFGLSLFVVFMGFGSCLLSASLTLACLSLPLIVTASEQAFLAVPQDYRDASYALGATRCQTIFKIVLPSAAPTIITGAILAVGRAAGETAPIMFTGAAFFAPEAAKGLFSQVMALPYHIYVLATSATNREAAEPIEYGAIVVLMALVLGSCAAAAVVRAKLSERRGG